jgi:hypothetical protein
MKACYSVVKIVYPDNDPNAEVKQWHMGSLAPTFTV